MINIAFKKIGKRGVYCTDSGLVIAYVSGMEHWNRNVECQITNDDIVKVCNACIKKEQITYRGIDILLTSEWPAGVTTFDEQAVSEIQNIK